MAELKMATETKTIHWLPLTPEEKTWFSNLIQNPLCDDEDLTSSKNREALWKRLNPPKSL